MKKTILLWCLALMIGGNLWSLSETRIGQEYITPLTYPKFSLSGDYSLGRRFYGFAKDAPHVALDNRFGAALSFETGLLKYLNAGGMFTFSFSSTSQGEPIDLRMGLFLKPYVSLGDRFSLFVRPMVGLIVPIGNNPIDYLVKSSPSFAAGYKTAYLGQEYQGSPFGGFGAATIGFDYFPFSRVGLSFEWGIRADILHVAKKNPSRDLAPKDVEGAPSSFNFMMYEMPLSLTINVIL